MKDLKVYIKKILGNYRHFICIGLTSIFLLLSIFFFKNCWGRLLETLPDIVTSGKFYFVELFELNIECPITINNFTKIPFEKPFNLPETWEEFKVLFDNYTSMLFTKENLKNYMYFLSDLIYYLSKILVILTPLIMLIVIIKMLNEDVINNLYNVDTPALTKFKQKIEFCIYVKIKNWLNQFYQFLLENSYYLKLWLLIWLYNFNFYAIIIEFISYYMYFIASFDFVSLYVQFLKLFTDLSPMINFVPKIAWLILLLVILDRIRKNTGYKRLNHMEMMDRGFINERSLVCFICGTMNKGKTKLATDIVISKEIMLRNKAFELILECDLEFPEFPWINLENTLKNAFKKHQVFNLASTDKFINHLKYCYLVCEQTEDNSIKKSIKRHLKKEFDIDFLNLIFDYDTEHYPTTYDNKLEIIDIWQTITDYSKLYLIYIIQSSLIIANYSIRVDNILMDQGNFPLWNTELFKRDTKMQDAISRHAHILDYDALRLGKIMVEDNRNKDFLEFGIFVFTEIGKERQNTLELQHLKKNDDECNQKNDGFDNTLKLARHSATVRHYPFIWFCCDEQRPTSWGANARELSEIIYIDSSKDFNITMPLFSLEDLICQWFLGGFNSKYYDYRFNRGDNTLPMYLYHKAASKVFKYQKSIYNTFGYYKYKLLLEAGTQDGEKESKNYYLMIKKIYSKRYSTDAFSDFFNERALRSVIGIDDLEEYLTEKATFEEMQKQNSYFFNDLMKLKEKGGK